MVITVSMKDALRIRPDASYGPPKGNATYSSRTRVERRHEGQLGLPLRAQDQLPAVWSPQPLVVCKPMWRPEDFRTFKGLCDMLCSVDPELRSMSKIWLEQFKRKHGSEKCDMMLAEIRRQDADAWFADKSKLKGA